MVHIKFVKHAVIAGSQLEFGTTLKSFVREVFPPRTHFIYLALHCAADGSREGTKALENVGDQIWRAAATTLFWRARRELPRRNFGSGLVELGFHLVGQLKLIFQIIVNPLPD